MQLPSLVCAAVLVWTMAHSSAAYAEPLQHFSVSYVVRARGVQVGEASYTFDFQSADYQATSSRRLSGLARTLMGDRQDFTYAARGQIDDDGRVRPNTYRHEDGRRHRVVEVSFSSNRVSTTARPPMSMGHPAATPEQKIGTIDQVSMFVQMLISHGNPCEQTLRVLMDGRTRFDLILEPDGQRNVSLAGFQGQAHRCAVRFTPIAGFSDPQEPARLTFLFAPSNGFFVPISVEMPTQDVGVVRLEAQTFTLVGSR